MASATRQYAFITANYWVFTLSDGALRMLVLLHFHQLGYSPLALASIFLFYEIFGVITNLLGGYLGARIGLNRTMSIGMLLQITSLLLLAVPSEYLSLLLVMFAQALSGIAKDLNKMSAKSSLKLLVPEQQQGQLFKWVAILTGSKNALKGVGFFLGGALLSLVGFHGALYAMVGALGLMSVFSAWAITSELGKAKNKPKFSQLFAKSKAINILSAARLFLFGARDVWFVVALPVFLSAQLGWSFAQVGAFLAVWVIGYGLVQSLAPKIIRQHTATTPTGTTALHWALILTLVTSALAIGFYWQGTWQLLLLGLLIFGVVFAVNSSLHSYLIVQYAQADGVSLDVGFYYMANAMGRLIGTLLSGWLFGVAGMELCLIVSALMIAAATVLSLKLPKNT